MKNAIVYIVLVLYVSLLQAQSYSKKAIQKVEEAKQLFSVADYSGAVRAADVAIKTDPRYIDAYLIKAVALIENKQTADAVETYKKGLAIQPAFFPPAFVDLANTEFSLGRYDDAKKHYEQFLSFSHTSESLRKKATEKIRWCEFAIRAMNNPVHFVPINMGDSINSVYDDYWPSLSADEQILIFTSNIPKDISNKSIQYNRQEDFFISMKEAGQWRKAVNAGPPLNTQDNEGAQSVTIDGRALFFTACNRSDGKGLCDIYFSSKSDGRWQDPVCLPAPVNTQYSEKQPSISLDKKILFFSSNRTGSYGGMDIWVTNLDSNGRWMEPRNVGETINTQGNETAPFIHHDGKTLYFSSDGHPGMGGMDLFVTRKDSAGNWSTPLNMGYPINTWHDEEGLYVNAAGTMAYYSSNRLQGAGKDIYMFEMPTTLRPFPVSYVKGYVYDAKNRRPLSASFELTDILSGQSIMNISSAKDGSFIFTIPSGKKYALAVNKSGYLFFSEHFSLLEENSYQEPFLMDIPLVPIIAGEKIVLKNIFFETDKYTLSHTSLVELKRVVLFLQNNPGIRVEISGHTDDVGTDAYNKKLSENRAKAVVDYLIESGISSSRMVFAGYGKTQAIADNSSPEGRALNRRTEMKILDVLP